ncbi:MAG: di-trans,poly-cis-decaprenylcistransferase [Bdellovibrionaceae bacterium]|nr:di-trans,poly-cis-decaprenylcistransferase [Pseudobdellovibrionaceae bacterium]|tara:strand:- start:238630 stop:239346 length:717 start_codon:yes stop_codon:yes gene_type:complete
MDGNGRWAQARGHSRFWGHIRGAKAATRTIRSAVDLGVKNLTLFTFSTENWKRPEMEVNFLMHLLSRQLKKELKMLMENNVHFSCVGDISVLPKHAQKALAETMQATKDNTGLNLVFALNYSGRQDLLSAAKEFALRAQRGEVDPHSVTEEDFNQWLAGSERPHPDLIIRTSGELRVSNFFLWQAAYSELYFTDKLWPDFKHDDFLAAITEFNHRERRFGQTGDQVARTSDSMQNDTL